MRRELNWIVSIIGGLVYLVPERQVSWVVLVAGMHIENEHFEVSAEKGPNTVRKYR